MPGKLYPNWQEVIVFAAEGPHPQVLLEQDSFRAVLAGLEAGQRIPPHPEGCAVYHFLEGEGWMIVDGERIKVTQGATVVMPRGAVRGIEAVTRLAFLAARE